MHSSSFAKNFYFYWNETRPKRMSEKNKNSKLIESFQVLAHSDFSVFYFSKVKIKRQCITNGISSIAQSIRLPGYRTWSNDKLNEARGRRVRVVMASGWESEGPGFESRRVQSRAQTPAAPGNPWPQVAKKNKWFPAKNSVPFMKKNR